MLGVNLFWRFFLNRSYPSLQVLVFSLFLLLCSYGAAFGGAPLIIGVEDQDWGGHYAWKGQELVGLDADIVRAVAKRIGCEVKFEAYPWKRVIHMAESRQIDAVLDLAPTELRQRFIYYTEVPLSLESTVFWITKNGDFSFDGTFDKRTRLGLMAGSDWSDRFSVQGMPTVVRFNNYEAAFRNLVAGRIDAFGNHLAPTREQAKGLGFLHLIKPSKPILENLTYYLGFTHKPEGRKLAELFSKGLESFFKSDEYKALLHKYGADDMENPLDYVPTESK